MRNVCPAFFVLLSLVLQFCRSKDLIQFELVRTTSMDKGAFSPRHGTVIQITEKEFEILKKRYK